MLDRNRPAQSLTTTYTGIARAIETKIHIGAALDPASKQGPINPQTCGAVEFDAIWDTGATGCVITRNVVQRCSLAPIGMVNVNTAGGQRVSPVYLVSLFLPNRVYFPSLRVTEGTLVGADFLIGMDVITRGDFAITNSDGHTTFSFRWPSSTKIDFVATDRARQQVKGVPKVGRNDPCPCGSGKKYKKCHGAVQPSSIPKR